MTHARPEYSIILAIFGILLAIGVPAFHRGQWVTGGICVGLAIALLGWVALALWRARGN